MARGPTDRVVSRLLTFQSPVGGWNARDSFDAMGPQDAIQMDNIFPETTACALRPGYAPYCTLPTSAAVKTLATWQGGTSAKLLAGAGGAIYDITTGTPTSLGSGFASDVWQTTVFATLGGVYTLFFNGQDVPQVYNGSTLAASTIAVASGSSYSLNPNNLAAPTIYQQRLYLLEAGTLHLWYAGVGEFQGATLNALDLGAFCNRGGQLSSINSWTRVNPYTGIQQLLVVVTSEGEVLIFSGTDPSNASTFGLTGYMRVARPVAGYRSMVNLGAECILLSADGYEPISQYLLVGQNQAQKTAISAKIGNAVAQAVQAGGTLFGWEGCLLSLRNQMIFNVPQPEGSFQQHVTNTITDAWCRYVGMPSYTWIVVNDAVYFGGPAGAVFEWGSASSDNGATINAALKTAFRYPTEGGQQCRFLMARPVILSNIPVTLSVGCSVDFDDAAPTTAASSTNSGNTLIWDSGSWDEKLWDGSPTVQRQWQSLAAPLGYSVAITLGASLMDASMQLNSIDLMFEAGGFL